MDFLLGCNYWASNAGTEMWNNWDEDAIRKDIKTLAEYGSKHLRVFPNWRDFQPATRFYGCQGQKRDICHIDGSLFKNENYLDELMMQRFGIFCDICEEYNVKLIVSLITGWMSGRLFVPPILEEKNLFTDPLAMRLELKFIKGFVSAFKDRKCIIAWGLGNECNCLSPADTDIAAAWTGNIVNAIKAVDNKKPVISDMHGLSVAGEWQIKDQAEYCDILTTHPYPHFVNHCHKDGMLSFRTLMHLPCENKLYSDIGNKPCFPEEIGTLGPMTCDENTTVRFLKATAYHSLLGGHPGFMWWCANEQSHLNTPPYAWNMMERELGLLDLNGNPKATLFAIKEISEKINSFDFELTPPKDDIVCITSMTQDNWGISYMSYALAKSLNLQLKFAYSKDELPQSEVYMLPSISGDEVMPKENYFELKRRVYDGAVLYISCDNGYLTEFSELCGIKVKDTKIISEQCEVKIDDERFKLSRDCRREIYSVGAKVLGYDNSGLPALTVNSYGKGKVYYLNFPLEKSLLEKNDVFSENYNKIYGIIYKSIIDSKPLKTDNPNVKITFYEDRAILFNYSDEVQSVKLTDKNDNFICEKQCEPYDICVVNIIY